MGKPKNNVKNIGLLFETIDDAKLAGDDLNNLIHWREPNEIASIRSAIEKLGFTTTLIGTPAFFARNSYKYISKIDFIFNISCGFNTRFRQANGCAICELLGLPYSGADPYTKISGQNKHIMKSFLNQLNVPTPEWTYIDNIDIFEKLKLPDFPLIVKPTCEGTSVGIFKHSVVNNFKELKKSVKYVLYDLGWPALIERFISGREFKVGQIGNKKIKFTGLLENTLSDGNPLREKFLYLNAKKESSFTKIRRNESAKEFTNLIRDCRYVYNHFLPLDYGVFDIRMDETGNFYFLEFNTDASLHPDRTLSHCCQLNDISFDQMIALILESAFERWNLEINFDPIRNLN